MIRRCIWNIFRIENEHLKHINKNIRITPLRRISNQNLSQNDNNSKIIYSKIEKTALIG